MKKFLGLMAVLLALGVIIGCAGPTDGIGEIDGLARAAVPMVLRDADTANPIILEGTPSARTNASGPKITSNSHSNAFPGILFRWDNKQKHDGFLKVDSSVFEQYESFVLTRKTANVYTDFTITIDFVRDEDGEVERDLDGKVKFAQDPNGTDNSFVFFIPRTDKNINMVFISDWIAHPPVCECTPCGNCNGFKGDDLCGNDRCENVRSCTCCAYNGGAEDCDNSVNCDYCVNCEQLECLSTCCFRTGGHPDCTSTVPCPECDDCGVRECMFDCKHDRCDGCGCCQCALNGGGMFLVGVNKGVHHMNQLARFNGNNNWEPIVDLRELIAGEIEILEIEMINGNSGNGNNGFHHGGMVYAKFDGSNLIILVDGSVPANGRQVNVHLYQNNSGVASGNTGNRNAENIVLPWNGQNWMYISSQGSVSYFTPFMIPAHFDN